MHHCYLVSFPAFINLKTTDIHGLQRLAQPGSTRIKHSEEMAKLPDGILGGFKGRIGNIIGAVRNGTQYIRSAPNQIKDPKTPKQQANRKKFALANKLAYRLGPFIEKGFAAAEQKTPRGACISANMKSGIFEEGDSGIRYANIMVSAGALRQVESPVAERTETGNIRVTWKDNSRSGNALGDDRIMILAMAEEKQFHACYILEGAERSSEEDVLELDSVLKNETAVHVYLSVISESRNLTANSEYLGFV